MDLLATDSVFETFDDSGIWRSSLAMNLRMKGKMQRHREDDEFDEGYEIVEEDNELLQSTYISGLRLKDASIVPLDASEDES